MKKFYSLLLALAACSISAFALDGALTGHFTINADGGQIIFSQGNLQYQASTQTWRFAENQYDTIGSANANISDTYDGWIDLFGWGTGNNPTLSSTNDADYSTFTDWGVNAISNGGQTADIWHTLSAYEWRYLFLTRENAAALFGLGSVNGVKGLILLPDTWIQPEGTTFNNAKTTGFVNQGSYYSNNTTDHFNDNIYTAGQWQIMQENGAVFLPASGRRNGKSMYTDDLGYYWTSDEDAYEYGTEGLDMFFRDNLIRPMHSIGNSSGASVRLVRQVANTNLLDEQIAVSCSFYKASAEAFEESNDSTFADIAAWLLPYIEEAEAVRNNPDATQEEIDAAAEKMYYKGIQVSSYATIYIEYYLGYKKQGYDEVAEDFWTAVQPAIAVFQQDEVTLEELEAAVQIVEEAVAAAEYAIEHLDVEQVHSDQVQCTKVLREGKFFILRGEKTFTLQGQELK